MEPVVWKRGFAVTRLFIPIGIAVRALARRTEGLVLHRREDVNPGTLRRRMALRVGLERPGFRARHGELIYEGLTKVVQRTALAVTVDSGGPTVQVRYGEGGCFVTLGAILVHKMGMGRTECIKDFFSNTIHPEDLKIAEEFIVRQEIRDESRASWKDVAEPPSVVVEGA